GIRGDAPGDRLPDAATDCAAGRSDDRRSAALRTGEDCIGVSAAAPIAQRLLAEFGGTAILLAAVVGSGVMGVRLSAGNDAIALLANSLATVGSLWVLIEILGPVSGAHFNPAVSLVCAMRGDLGWGSA